MKYSCIYYLFYETKKSTANSRGYLLTHCLLNKNNMAKIVLNNTMEQLPNSYANLFHVAQYNLTLWTMEENLGRTKKKQKRLTSLQPEHGASWR